MFPRKWVSGRRYPSPPGPGERPIDRIFVGPNILLVPTSEGHFVDSPQHRCVVHHLSFTLCPGEIRGVDSYQAIDRRLAPERRKGQGVQRRVEVDTEDHADGIVSYIFP